VTNHRPYVNIYTFYTMYPPVWALLGNKWAQEGSSLSL